MMRSLWTVVPPALLLLVGLGCAGALSPSAPSMSPDINTGAANPPKAVSSQTQLWGYFDVCIDPDTGRIEIVDNRQAMFTANVVNFINSKPTGLSFKINSTDVFADYVDVDIDVAITHPFPGLPQYNGYDVRGIFMGNGSAVLDTGGAAYPVNGEDQFMFPNPDGGNGGPDGYTRWFNREEFSMGGMPLFQYTKGKLATPGFNGTASICPYRYFADGLDTNEDLWSWINSNADQNGRFSSGATNKRNYFLRFPNAAGVEYGYAIIANWGGEDVHPSNAPEAVACEVVDDSDVWYVNGSNKGGSVELDISLFNWFGQPSAIVVESTVLSSPHNLTPAEMTPIGGDENHSTWHVDIPADAVAGTDGNEYWVIAQYDACDYSNDFGAHNLVEEESLAAYFRYDLPVSGEPTNTAPVCDLVVDPASPAMPYDGWSETFGFDATGSYDPDGDALTFEWDFNNDGTYGDSYYSGTDDNPFVFFNFTNQSKVWLKLTDGNGGETVCSVNVNIKIEPSKNISLRSGVNAKDIAVNPSTGNLLVSFDDLQVFKYSRSSFYQSGSYFFTVYGQLPRTDGPLYIENSAQDNTMIASTAFVTVQTEGWLYGPSGNQVIVIGHGGEHYPADAMTMVSGSYANDLGMIHGEYYSPPAGTYITRYARYSPTNNFWPPLSNNYYSYPPPYSGPSVICITTIVAAESDKNSSCIWFIKNVDGNGSSDCYAARWAASGNSLVYDNACFGTGSKSDGNTSWNKARDITRDNQNRIFVLDELSTGDAKVKVWSVSGNTTTSLGGFGDTTTISGAPLRIEGSDFEQIVIVLHGATSPQKISVFVHEEMP